MGGEPVRRQRGRAALITAMQLCPQISSPALLMTREYEEVRRDGHYVSRGSLVSEFRVVPEMHQNQASIARNRCVLGCGGYFRLGLALLRPDFG